MEWSKLKTIILILLLIVDLFLVGLALYLHHQTRQTRLDAEADLVALFAEHAITLDPAALPDEKSSFVLHFAARNSDAETGIASALLGSVTESSLEAGEHVFRSDRGTAVFYADGTFSFTPVRGTFPLTAEPREQAESYLRQMGIEAICIDVLATSRGTEVIFLQTLNDLPLFPCRSTLRFSSTELLSCSGRCVPGDLTVYGSEAAHTLPTLLLRFLTDVSNGGDICNRIDALAFGYHFTAYGSVISPVLCISTDIGDYYVDALSGTVDRSALLSDAA